MRESILVKFAPTLAVLLLCIIQFQVVDATGEAKCFCQAGANVSGQGPTMLLACENAMARCPLDDQCEGDCTCPQGAQPCTAAAISVRPESAGLGYVCSLRCDAGNPEICVSPSPSPSSSPTPSPTPSRTPTPSPSRTPRPCPSPSVPPSSSPSNPSNSPPPGGQGDPHLTGFDGSAFDFHGIHAKHYVMFGRPSGDLLVTKMRATDDMDKKNGLNGTFFDEFGLQTTHSNDYIKVSLEKSSLKESVWWTKVEVNGKHIKADLNLPSCRVSISPDQKSISITTKETKFVIKAKSLNNRRKRHLDLEVGLVGGPKTSERYVGVLGVTLNRVVGHEIHPDLDVSNRGYGLETALRKRFEVESLFPERSNKDNLDTLSGVLRVISDVQYDTRTWTAWSQFG